MGPSARSPSARRAYEGSSAGETLCAEEKIPRLNARGYQSLCAYPGVIGETTVDVGFAGGLRDQKHSDAVVFSAGEWASEQHETLICKTVHEGGVVVHRGLLEGAFSIGPARTGFTGNGE